MADYNEAAEQAARAQLAPASVDETAAVYAELGASRQVAHRWRRQPEKCPLPARMAAAWIIAERAARDREEMERQRSAIVEAVQTSHDAATLRRVAELMGVV